MKEQIKVWVIRIVVLGLLFVAAKKWGMPLYKAYFTPKETVAFVPTSVVKKGPFVVSFHEMGTLEAEKSVPVVNMVNGKIIKLVSDGSMVKQGDRICELDTSEMENEHRNAQLTFKNALSDVDRANAELAILKESNKTTVAQSEAELKFSQTELEQAKEQLDKKQRLAQDKLVTKDSVTAAEIDVRAKQLAVTKQEMALALQKDKVLSDEKQKEKDVEKVKFAAAIQKNALEGVEKRMKQAAIDSPASGLVVLGETWDGANGSRKLQEGDATRWRQTICNIPDLSSMLVKIKLGESDAPKIQIGLPVLIKLDSVPNKVFHGTVKDIASLARTSQPWEGGTGRKEIEVKIAIKESDPKVLKPGMSADVEFICKQVKDTLYVPIEAVQEKDNKTYAFVKEGKSYRRVAVKTGLENDSFVCIPKGLAKGQTVALSDPTKTMGNQNTLQKKEKKASSAPMPTSGKK